MGCVFGEVGPDEDVVEVGWAVHAHDWFIKANALSVSFPVVEMTDGDGVSFVDDAGWDVGGVVADVDDGLDAAGCGGASLCRCFFVGCVLEGLDEEGGDVVVRVASLSEVCVEFFDVFVSHFCVAVQVLEAEELAEDEAFEG